MAQVSNAPNDAERIILLNDRTEKLGGNAVINLTKGMNVNMNLNSLDSMATAAVNLLSTTQCQPHNPALINTLHSQGVSAFGNTRQPVPALATTKIDNTSDKEQRVKQRRSQIAAASRKSRAKRKREHSVLKEENELLLLEVSALRKRLREHSDTDSTGDKKSVERCQANSSRSVAKPAEVKTEPSNGASDLPKYDQVELTREARSQAQKEIFERVKTVISSDLRAKLTAEPKMPHQLHLGNIEMSVDELLGDARDELKAAILETPVLQEIIDFFHKQLLEYFAFLKYDVINHFGFALTKEKREAVVGLMLRFFSP